jgi:hypothetical protein
MMKHQSIDFGSADIDPFTIELEFDSVGGDITHDTFQKVDHVARAPKHDHIGGGLA